MSFVLLSKKKSLGKVKNRAKHGLRGFMPRNVVAPYECRRHEVRGGGHPRHLRLTDAKVCKIPFFKRLYKVDKIPRTSPLATLVGSYGATYSRSSWSCDPCFARLFYGTSVLLSSNPLGLQPLPLYFTYVKHMGRKGYLTSARGRLKSRFYGAII